MHKTILYFIDLKYRRFVVNFSVNSFVSLFAASVLS